MLEAAILSRARFAMASSSDRTPPLSAAAVAETLYSSSGAKSARVETPTTRGMSAETAGLLAFAAAGGATSIALQRFVVGRSLIIGPASPIPALAVPILALIAGLADVARRRAQFDLLDRPQYVADPRELGDLVSGERFAAFMIFQASPGRRGASRAFACRRSCICTPSRQRSFCAALDSQRRSLRRPAMIPPAVEAESWPRSSGQDSAKAKWTAAGVGPLRYSRGAMPEFG